MLSDQYKYIIQVLDLVQGYPVCRPVEELVFIKLKLEEITPEYKELNNDNPLTPEERWSRDVAVVQGFLFEDGSMYCRNQKMGGFYLARKPEVIADELLYMGLFWVDMSHVKQAQKQMKG